MFGKFRSSLVVATVAALAIGSLDLAPAQAASAGQQQAKPAVSVDLSARKRHYRHRHYRGGDRAALAMFGMMMGTIATLAARDQARSDCRYYGHCYGYYGYPGPRHYRYRRYYPY